MTMNLITKAIKLLALAPNSLDWAVECAKEDGEDPTGMGISPETLFQQMVKNWMLAAPQGRDAFLYWTDRTLADEHGQVAKALRTFNGDYAALRDALRLL